MVFSINNRNEQRNVDESLPIVEKHFIITKAYSFFLLLKRRVSFMRLDGFGLFVNDMGKMIRFYRDVLGFAIKESEDASNVYLVKDGTLFLLYGQKDFEAMTSRKYDYVKGLNGHSEMALYVDTFKEVDAEFKNAVDQGATPILEPTTEPWGQRTCYIADPEGNLIEIGSWNKPFESKDA